MQTYGGPRVQTPVHSQRTFFYGGLQQQQFKAPTFESLTKNRILQEIRFYCNNSNTKWLSIGVVPASKILDESAPGFYLDVQLGGEKCASLPLDGIKGLAGLFSTIREVPAFSKIPVVHHGVEKTDNITIATVDFADDVSVFVFFFSENILNK